MSVNKLDHFDNGILWPNWPTASSVKACVTTRLLGHSRAPYDSMNLSLSVGDDAACVMRNRADLRKRLRLPAGPAWLQQVHGNRVVVIERATSPGSADAAVSFEAGRVCVVTVADCLPVFFCDHNATRVAVAHGGWRGLAAGVLEQTVATLDCAPQQLKAYLGPAIGPQAYQVGDPVRDAFIKLSDDYALAFLPDNRGAWMVDLYQIARLKLQRIGVMEIYGGWHCTYHDDKHFFSYRRAQRTGRMAALIWLDKHT